MMTFVCPTESATRAQRAFPRAHLLEMTAVLKTSISRVVRCVTRQKTKVATDGVPVALLCRIGLADVLTPRALTSSLQNAA
jgi:hypothetical protein